MQLRICQVQRQSSGVSSAFVRVEGSQMTTLWHLARLIAWHMGEHHATAVNQPPAHITVFSADGVESF